MGNYHANCATCKYVHTQTTIFVGYVLHVLAFYCKYESQSQYMREIYMNTLTA